MYEVPRRRPQHGVDRLSSFAATLIVILIVLTIFRVTPTVYETLLIWLGFYIAIKLEKAEEPK